MLQYHRIYIYIYIFTVFHFISRSAKPTDQHHQTSFRSPGPCNFPGTAESPGSWASTALLPASPEGSLGVALSIFVRYAGTREPRNRCPDAQLLPRCQVHIPKQDDQIAAFVVRMCIHMDICVYYLPYKSK